MASADSASACGVPAWFARMSSARILRMMSSRLRDSSASGNESSDQQDGDHQHDEDDEGNEQHECNDRQEGDPDDPEEEGEWSHRYLVSTMVLLHR